MANHEDLSSWAHDLDHVDNWIGHGDDGGGGPEQQETRNLRAASGLHQHGHLSAEDKAAAKSLVSGPGRDAKAVEHLETAQRKDLSASERKHSWMNFKNAVGERKNSLQVDSLGLGGMGLGGMGLFESETNLLLGGSLGDFMDDADMNMDAFDFSEPFGGGQPGRRGSVQKQRAGMQGVGAAAAAHMQQTPQQMQQMQQLQQQMHAHGVPARPSLMRPQNSRGGSGYGMHQHYPPLPPHQQQQQQQPGGQHNMGQLQHGQHARQPPPHGMQHLGAMPPAAPSKWAPPPPPPPPSHAGQARFDVNRGGPPRGPPVPPYASSPSQHKQHQQQQQQQQQTQQTQQHSQQQQFAGAQGLGFQPPLASPTRSASGGSDDMLNDDSFTPKEKKNERERRRRLQVSHGFTELFKVLKLSDAAKMEKSTVLNASIDRLKELGHAHALLLDENRRLRMQAAKAGIKV